MLVTGCIGAGKTTLRRQKFGDGYVHLDAAEIFAMFTEGKYYDFPGIFRNELDTVGLKIAQRTMAERKNIVMEILGDTDGPLQAVAEAMHSVGYKVNLSCVACPLEECQKRHKYACDTDVNYVSAYHTQAFHLKWLLAAAADYRKNAAPSRAELRG
ncbi:MAG: hypothetical protein A2089_06240 [Elusimicrobia bacterium GWD2_63_28]|nr:MAG: hypothetical protein A2089_06240 [Elusimicrobia bacterium GWD2_63_28]